MVLMLGVVICRLLIVFRVRMVMGLLRELWEVVRVRLLRMRLCRCLHRENRMTRLLLILSTSLCFHVIGLVVSVLRLVNVFLTILMCLILSMWMTLRVTLLGVKV